MSLPYLNEYRYTVTPRIALDLLPISYVAGGPRTDFERSVQAALAQANSQFLHEEFSLALDSYRELSSLILTVAHPELPPSVTFDPGFLATRDVSLLSTFVDASSRILSTSAVTRSLVPSTALPGAGEVTLLENVAVEGLVRDFSTMDIELKKATEAAASEDWVTAQSHFKTLVESIPDCAVEAKARALHDLAIAQEKVGSEEVTGTVQRAQELFHQVQSPSLQARGLQTLVGILTRTGNPTQALGELSTLSDLQKTRALTPVVLPGGNDTAPEVHIGIAAAQASNSVFSSTAVPNRTVGPVLSAVALDPELRPIGEQGLVANAIALGPQQMLSPGIDLNQVAAATLVIRQDNGAFHSVAIDANLSTSLQGLLSTISTTSDFTLLTGWYRNPHLLIAYLPHVYFFVIPVAIGDCLKELGQFDQAEASYLGTLAYPFINQQVEIVSLWTKLANLYLEQGEALYRVAGNDPAQFASAKAFYQRVVKSDNTLDPTSPLYQNPQFAAIKTRVQAFLALPPGTASTDNPAVIGPVLQSLQRLGQIAAGLNYFGFPPGYAPPFSFEYLQSQARYLADQASRMDEAYINFKSTAENEEFRSEQMDQQTAVATATLELQQRNLAEAQAGVSVAQASLNFATQQKNNADNALATFINVSQDLIDIAETQAALGAISLPAFQGKPASDVASDLAGTQTMLSNALEGQRLLGELTAAGKYVTVAQAQFTQAQQRVAVAEQSVAIARLQQRYAAENSNFLDRKEFSAGLWYELAKFIKSLSRRYLDMAIEVAFLMERAYALETARDLKRIRFDYISLGPNHLLGGDLLLADIDSFTLDYVASTRAKKAPMKIVLSLAAQFPSALFNLRQTGSCVFETTLEQLDRSFAGIYLAKVRNVAVNFIGISPPEGISGTLRNTGVSRFRDSAGNEIQLVYPADILPLSAYDVRQDALFFRFNPNELRIFENSGPGTAWRLDFPLDANDVDFSTLVDVQISVFFDAFFSADLESKIRAGLPASGSSLSAFSFQLFFPDELFFLKNQGTAVVEFDSDLFPFNQVNLKITRVRVRIGSSQPVAGLRLHVAPKNAGGDLDITSDAQGLADSKTAGSPLAALVDRPPQDQWTLTVKSEENPAFIKNGQLDLSSVEDMQVFIEYTFDFRK